jgi:preprotein translocase subunit SecE
VLATATLKRESLHRYIGRNESAGYTPASRLHRLNIATVMLGKTKNFFSEVKVELQKASWPWDPKEKGVRRYKELTDSTLVVIIAMLLLGGYVALFDFVLVNVVHYFTRVH